VVMSIASLPSVQETLIISYAGMQLWKSYQRSAYLGHFKLHGVNFESIRYFRQH
jgi:hypothetical protein